MFMNEAKYASYALLISRPGSIADLIAEITLRITSNYIARYDRHFDIPNGGDI